MVFPMEFYLAFWQSLGADLVQVLIFAFESGQLSTSQHRGLIIVLYKKNDHLDTKNWCPISLLNVDYRIATRAISAISKNHFLIRDFLEYLERKDPSPSLPRPRESF